MSFTDFNAQQRDLAHILLSDPYLADVNIVLRHELLEPSMLARLPDKTLAAEVLCYFIPRNSGTGRRGCGIIVERPEFSVQSPNVTGPQGEVICEFLVLSDRGMNESPRLGTLRKATDVAQRILDLFHLFNDASTGTYRAQGRAIQAANDFQPLDAYRVTLASTQRRAQTARCAPVAAAIVTGSCTLTCTTAAADLWYSMGGQDAEGNWLEPAMPAPSNSGGGAQLYAGPFAVAAGQIIRACAFKQNLNPSSVSRTTAA